MSKTEYEQELWAMLDGLPQEFRECVAAYAWEQGHSSGYSEVLLYAADLTDLLKAPLASYTKRITKGATHERH
jgi:hypothetical protein